MVENCLLYSERLKSYQSQSLTTDIFGQKMGEKNFKFHRKTIPLVDEIIISH